MSRGVTERQMTSDAVLAGSTDTEAYPTMLRCGGNVAMNGKNVTSCTAAGICAPGLRLGPARRSRSASDLLVRVAGAMP
jgi:hypothetical protein